MAKRDFFTPVSPVEAAVRVVKGREELVRQLAVPASRGAVDNDVQFSGTFVDSRKGVYDAFAVTVNGPAEVTDAERRRFAALGCEVASVHGLVAIVHQRHAHYDNRLWKIDMSPAQCAMALSALAIAALLAAAATLL